jgi:hypothetical protein
VKRLNGVSLSSILEGAALPKKILSRQNSNFKVILNSFNFKEWE